MPQDTRTQPVCAPHCTALSPDIRHDFQDEPLAVEHFGCVWRTYERRVRARVRQALAKLGLAALARRLDERSPGVRRPSTSVVRMTLRDDDALVEDLCQDVAFAFWKAVHVGGVRAAVGCVEKWFSVVTQRIVRRQARRAALLALVAPPTNDNASYVEVPTTGIVLAANDTDPEDPTQPYRLALAEKPQIWSHLSETEREAFTPWLDGEGAPTIAKRLGIEPGAVRLRLMRARRRLAPFILSEDDEVA